MKLTLLTLVLVAVVLAQDPPVRTKVYSFQWGSAQVIDSDLSYISNIRYSPNTGDLYFRSDKSHPNIFVAESTGEDPHSFYMEAKSPFPPNSPPAIAFDVVSIDREDYVVGTSYGSNERNGFGLYVELLKRNSEPFFQIEKDYYFYSVVIDSRNVADGTQATAYMVGWKYSDPEYGAIVVRAKVNTNANQITFSKEQDILMIESDCYDLWDEFNKPYLFLDFEDSENSLVVAFPGHCTELYKITIPAVGTPFGAANVQKGNPLGDNKSGDKHFTSIAFHPKQHRLYYSIRTYNSPGSTLATYDTKSWALETAVFPLASNESNPIIAIDTATDNIFVASSGLDRIYKLKRNMDTKKLEQLGVAPLDDIYHDVSDMVIVNNWLYFVTWEPDAKIARIPTNAFCKKWCSQHGYCVVNGETESCACLPGFEMDPKMQKAGIDYCQYKHVVEVQEKFIKQKGATAALAVLFVFTLLIAGVGWFLWWRVRGGSYSTLS